MIDAFSEEQALEIKRMIHKEFSKINHQKHSIKSQDNMNLSLKDLKIATFGSCLSRFTANNFKMLFGGEIVSSIYHNRSDVFVGRFIKKNIAELNRSEIVSLIKNKGTDVIVENDGFKIIENQFKESQGKHRLTKGQAFGELLENKNVDLFIFDNYMDIGARLVTISGTSQGSEWFLRPDDLVNPTLCKPGELLSPVEGALSMVKIIKTVMKNIPDAKIVFCNFPYNTYVNSTEREARTKEYEVIMNEFSGGDFMTIPSLTIPEKLQTSEKQHFKPQVYSAYAGIIWSYINQL